MQRYCEQMGSIIDRRRAEQALKAARASAEMAARSATQAMMAAQTSDRAKSQFIANISHELRTPVHAIIGFSQLMDTEAIGPLGNPEYKTYAHDIHDSAAQLLSVINNVLDLAKIDAGTVTLSEDTVDLNELTSHCLRLMKGEIEPKGLDVRFEPDSNLPLLWADERKIKQIVLNLLSNAVKFTAAGGSVTLGWSVPDGGGLEFSITDTGIGIAFEDRERIFEPFTQADGTHTRQFEGAGLGLPLVRGLAELHDGRIAIDSEPDKGTTVCVTFPSERKRDNAVSGVTSKDQSKEAAA